MDDFLRPPRDDDKYVVEERPQSFYYPLRTFELPRGEGRSYQQQYADIYFVRLTQLKPAVAEIAAQAWDGLLVAGERAKRVERVLDVQQGEVCWLVGTIFMDLPGKPNILEDIMKEHFQAKPDPIKTYRDPTNQHDFIMIEDESGRLRLSGDVIRRAALVTGAIVAVVGTETDQGDFEVFDVKVPDFPPQPRRWELLDEAGEEGYVEQRRRRDEGDGDGGAGRRKKVAFLSGLEFSGVHGDGVASAALRDYLLGGSEAASGTSTRASQISRLIIAGNSIGREAVHKTLDDNDDDNDNKKFRYDPSSFNISPIEQLDNFLAEILPSVPVTIMPGESDPANYCVPQQQIHRAMLPRAKAYCSEKLEEPGWLDNVTNPWEGEVEGWRVWGCSGQNVDDILRYLDFKEEGDGDGMEERLRTMEALVRWRLAMPTAPDTLFCYPYQDRDPFILEACPHVFFAGNQAAFRTKIIEKQPDRTDDDGMDVDGEEPVRVRLMTLPRFSETGELVLLDTETLETEVVKFEGYELDEEKKGREGSEGHDTEMS